MSISNEEFVGSISTGVISAFAYGLGNHLSGQPVALKRVAFVALTGSLISLTLKAAAQPIIRRMV